MSQRFNLGEFQVSSRVVFGLSTFPFDAESNDLLIKSADIAMYHAKRNGQLMAFYNEDMNVGGKYQLFDAHKKTEHLARFLNSSSD